MPSPLSIVLELTRIAEPDDPHAFRFEPQGYTLRGPIGGVDRFDIPWSAGLLEDLEALRQPGRDPAVIQRVGDVMQRALRSIGWTGLGERIRAASATGRPVVVTLPQFIAGDFRRFIDLAGRGHSQPGPKARSVRHRDNGQRRPAPARWLPTAPRLTGSGRAHARPRDPWVLARSCPDFVSIPVCLETTPRIRARSARYATTHTTSPTYDQNIVSSAENGPHGPRLEPGDSRSPRGCAGSPYPRDLGSRSERGLGGGMKMGLAASGGEGWSRC